MIDITSNGYVLASSCYDGSVKLWDMISSNCLGTIIDDHDFIPKYILIYLIYLLCIRGFIKFTSNDQYMLVSSMENIIKLWDYHISKYVKTYEVFLCFLYLIIRVINAVVILYIYLILLMVKKL